MKRLFVVLLAVGLIAAFSMPAFSADVKISGDYFAAGYWESNRALKSSSETAQRYYGQRLRVNPVVQVADGLKLVTRFDALERVWGQDPIGSSPTMTNARNTAEEQNISWRRAYLSAKILGGTLDVGYMGGGRTGTQFMDYDSDVTRIKYVYVTGPWAIQVLTEKANEYSLARGNSDGDKDKYQVTPVYKWSSGEFGTQLQYYRYNDNELVASTPYRSSYYLLCPWFKTNFGPLYLEGEVNYYFGKYKDYLSSTTDAQDYKSLSYYLMAKYAVGSGYIGAQFARVAGDDPTTTDKYEKAPAPPAQSTIDYQPTLVLWNDWTNRWSYQANGTNGTIANSDGYYVSNALLYQIFAGFKPVSKLLLDARFTIATAEQKPSGYTSDSYGNELDLTAAYKIYDNLEYMVGFGYLWTGDYFKGTSSTNTVGNDWLLMHKLTLTF